MKVELNKRGLFVLTAETKADNMVLFSVTNNDHINGIQLRYDKKPVSVPITDNTNKTVTKTRRKQYMKDCPVEGCGERTKGISIHMRMKHGVWDDKVHDEFLFHGTDPRPVAKPVVQLPNGTYRVRPTRQLID